MNTLFGNLFGSLFGSDLAYPYSQAFRSGILKQQFGAYNLQQYVPCKHPGCSICAEENRKAIERAEKELEEVSIRKELYAERCKTFMEKWRRREG